MTAEDEREKRDQEAAQAGRWARAVLDNPAYNKAYDDIERALVSQLAMYEIAPERAEYLRQLLAAGRKHRALLERALNEGKFAEGALEREAAVRQAVRKVRIASPR